MAGKRTDAPESDPLKSMVKKRRKTDDNEVVHANNEYTLISLFSGAHGLDLGLEQAGLTPRCCVEIDEDCCNTLRLNRPEMPVIQRDIRAVTTQEILEAAGLWEGHAFCVAGGPPCQSFSSGGKRTSILDPRGSLFLEFVRVIRESKPLYFIFENVAQIVTAAIRHRPIAERPGKNWNLSAYSRPGAFRTTDDEAPALEADELSGSAIAAIIQEFEKLGYHLTYGVLNSADFGAPQRRLRFIVLGSRTRAQTCLPSPTHREIEKDGLPRWNTLRTALADLKDEVPLHSNYTEGFQRFFELIPPGGNWRNLSPELQRSALGNGYAAGGGKTGFFRRLAWDEPAPTIVTKPNRKSCAICHPDEIRPLTVKECARVQGFPDSWRFTGSMHAQYMQVGNAVPVALGRAIGAAIIEAHGVMDAGGASAGTRVERPEIRREIMLEHAKKVLRHSARNRIAKAAPAQLTLY